ncbi:Protein of unknown function [Bacillus wiedmannii]|nr:Protein of unknown function [Bacillus wiedmannii]
MVLLSRLSASLELVARNN